MQDPRERAWRPTPSIGLSIVMLLLCLSMAGGHDGGASANSMRVVVPPHLRSHRGSNSPAATGSMPLGVLLPPGIFAVQRIRGGRQESHKRGKLVKKASRKSGGRHNNRIAEGSGAAKEEKDEFDIEMERGNAIARARDQARKRRKARDEEPLEVDTNAAAPLRREKRTVRGASGWEGLAKKKKRTSADGDASGDVKQHADDPGTEDSSCRDAKLEQDGDDSNCTENCGQASRNSRSDYASGRGRGRGREDEATDKAELCKSPGTGNQVNISRGANVSNVKTRRGSGPSRSKRVHFTEGGRLLHSHVSKAGNVFDLMATLSVRMIPLELGDYREKWKDPLPFYDYQGEFRLDKMRQLISNIDPNTAAMIIVRICHLFREDGNKKMEARWLLLKKEMAPDGKQYYPGKNASKPSEGLFERYVQLPHLLAEAMERLENVAERLQPEISVRVMESLAGVRDAKNILMGKRIDGGSPLIHALVSAAISGHETLEAQQSARALWSLGRLNDDDNDPDWNPFKHPEGRTRDGIVTMIQHLCSKESIDELEHGDIVKLYQACSGLRMPDEHLLRLLGERVMSPLSPLLSLSLNGTKHPTNTTIEDMRAESTPMEGLKDAYVWKGRTFIITRDEWGRRVDVRDKKDNSTVYRYGNFSDSFKAQDIITILSSMASLEYLDLPVISCLLQRASHPRVARAFDGEKTCKFVRIMAQLALVPQDVRKHESWISFSQQDAQDIKRIVLHFACTNVTSSRWQCPWSKDNTMQSYRAKDHDPKRRPFYTVPHVRESIGAVLDAVTLSPQGMVGASRVDCADMVWGITILRPTKKTHLRVIASIKGLGLSRVAKTAYSLLPGC